MSQLQFLFSGESPSKDPLKPSAKTQDTPPSTPWHKMPFLCVDTETTGLDCSAHRVIEVAWILFENEKEIHADTRLCSIGASLPSEIVKLTGICDEMLINQPPFSSHAEDLLNAMTRVSFIVAYNANFDRLFLESEMQRIGKSMPNLPWIDPCVFIRQFDRYQKGKRLQDATARWGVTLKDAHRALADAKATGLLLYKLVSNLKSESLPELIKKQKSWQEEQDRQYKAYLAKKRP